ncbi:hypothetical protein [Desulforhopalus sp. IMCC35007]|uniref:hypothetical protein n=1 Tax=Desulforhopalus sp. IMCC35007 TaxID=2569543 RepID=UPI0010AEB285|nr:hypothetical protein [Desulforhopalus sp. IMCC35007]TKB12294.1 hypothetical protein FCL48_01175 [Desulforhopalus sp. IMCC35007]
MRFEYREFTTNYLVSHGMEIMMRNIVCSDSVRHSEKAVEGMTTITSTEIGEGAAEDSGSDIFFINIVVSNKESVSYNRLLMQKMLHQLIESYDFDQVDLKVNFTPQFTGHGHNTQQIPRNW